jgi:hypothetical protein
MQTTFRPPAGRRARQLSAQLARLRRAPLTWMITGGLVLMLAIAVGTGLGSLHYARRFEKPIRGLPRVAVCP